MQTQKSGYKQALQELKHELERIDSERKELLAAITALERLIARRNGHDRPQTSSTQFKGVTLKRAVTEYLALVGTPQGTTEIRDALLLGGYETKARNFYNAIYTTLARMEDVIKKNSKWQLVDHLIPTP